MRQLNLATILAIANHNIKSWRDIRKDFIGVAFSWAYYFTVPHLLDAGLSEHIPSWLMWLVQDLFWPEVFSTLAVVLKASAHSALPGMLCLALATLTAPFSLLGAGVLFLWSLGGFLFHVISIRKYLKKHGCQVVRREAIIGSDPVAENAILAD